jgi:cell division septation protein DedD
VSPERDEPTEEQEQELYEDVPPRSIFAATWFRVVLVVIVLGVIGAVAVPYVLDWMNPPPPPRSAATRTPGAPLAPSVFDRPLGEKPAGDKLAADKPAAEKPAEKKDSMLIPAPVAPPAPPTPLPAPANPPARTDLKSEVKPSTPAPAPARPPAEAKPAPARTETKAAAKPPATPRSAPKAAAAAKPSPPRPAPAKAAKPAAPAASGPFWVQVGAFKDPEAAKRLAGKLREENFKVEESVRRTGEPAAASKTPATAPAGADQYDVFVSGMSAEELNKRLAGKGLAAETSGDGVVVKPSLPLRDAVTLSKDLAVDGFKVQVRRAGGGATTVSAPSAPAEGGVTLHRVRVGAFADRAAARAAARQLEAKGYKPFIARGDQ